MTGTEATHEVLMYGLRVRSDIELPDWPVARGGEPDLRIRREPCPAPALEGEVHTARSFVEDGELRVVVVGVGRYAAVGGSVIRVDPEPDARAEDVRLYLTGALLGAILHQRGAFPLHASCVAIDGLGVAFAGRSGAGKSTLVAALVREGAAFVTDDVCVMTGLGTGEVGVWPGVARLRLDDRGLSALPARPERLEPAGGTRGKFQVPVAPAGRPAPVPLRRIYLITDGEGPPRVEPLAGLDAVSAVVEETYFLSFAAALGLSGQVFRLAGLVARAVQVSRLVRPRGLQHLASVTGLIRADAARP